jgi:hypothetical protein
MALGAASGGAGRQAGEPETGTVREAVLERHHQPGIPFWAPGKDSHHRRRPMAAHDGGRWTPWRKRWNGDVRVGAVGEIAGV